MKYGYSEVSWTKDHKLSIRKKKTKVSLIPHETYPDMYYVKWSDGTLGSFYNLTRAKDNAIKAVLYEWNMDAPIELEGRTET